MILRFSCAVVLVFASACGGAPTTPDGPSTTPKPSALGGDAARGERLFAELGCKGCHGSRTDPGGVGPNLFAVEWTAAEEAEARETILKGRPDHTPPMPKYEGEVDEAKLADLLAFVRAK